MSKSILNPVAHLVPSLVKVGLVATVMLASACDIVAALDHRDLVHNDEVCQPNRNGACW